MNLSMIAIIKEITMCGGQKKRDKGTKEIKKIKLQGKKNIEVKERKHTCFNKNVRAWVVSLGGKLRKKNQPCVK
jgi:hypothetical protein